MNEESLRYLPSIDSFIPNFVVSSAAISFAQVSSTAIILNYESKKYGLLLMWINHIKLSPLLHMCINPIYLCKSTAYIDG